MTQHKHHNKYHGDFPILAQSIHGKPLAYLDNASTTQKPRVVIDALTHYYETENSNIHRGIHELALRATEAYERTRTHVREFINAASTEEIIFTRNTTEAINIFAYSFERMCEAAGTSIKPGDTIMVSALEHHSNLIPWQQLAARYRARLAIIPLIQPVPYTLDFAWFEQHLDPTVKILALTHASNVTGTVVPISEYIKCARRNNTITIIDAAQSAPHMPIDVQELDCDALAFSAHKMCGPTGVGVLYVQKQLLEKMPPVLFGGEMVKDATYETAEWNDLPWRFEAGTPNIADVVAFDAALTYLEHIGLDAVRAHDQNLVTYAKKHLAEIPDLTLHTPADTAAMTGIISWTMKNIHPHDIAELMNADGIAIRSGHHCAAPLMKTLGVPATARMSFYFYNTTDEIDRAIASIERIRTKFSRRA